MFDVRKESNVYMGVTGGGSIVWKIAGRGVFKLFSINLIKNIENSSLFSAVITLHELYVIF